MPAPLLIRNARCVDGRLVDVLCRDGAVADVAAAGQVAAPVDAAVEDLAGWLLLPGPVEPHAHLDKALSADAVANPAGTLEGAITVWRQHRLRVTAQDVAARAETAVRRMVLAGTTTIRTHVDVSVEVGLRFVAAINEVRDRLATLARIQVVGLVSPPITGRVGADARALLRAALDAGVDVVGGAPHVHPDPRDAMALLFDVAGSADRPIDLHTDETLDPAVLGLADFAAMVGPGGYAPGATASHCVSLSVQFPDTQRAVSEAVAGAGISVVTLPQTNLFLQARGVATAPARGLTAVAALHAAGVNVAAGADNLQDPFNTVGRGDAFETAALMVMAAHLTPEQAWASVSDAASTALGVTPAAVAAGARADFLAVPAAGVRPAVADAPAERVVIHGGRVVARTTATRWLADAEPAGPAPTERTEPARREPLGVR